MDNMIIAFHGKQDVKDFFLARARAHYAADEIVHGQYWVDGKGCAVGCLVHSGSHGALASELNIPIKMAYLIDRLFEGQPNGHAKSFPVRFIESIPVGADLSAVMDRYFLALLSDKEQGVIVSSNDLVRDPIRAIIALFVRQIDGMPPMQDEWRVAYGDADSAAAAHMADDRAAAAYSAAAYMAAHMPAAAYSAADMAAYAYSAAAMAAYAYSAAAADRAAFRTALSNHFIWQAELLLRLLSEAPVPVAA